MDLGKEGSLKAGNTTINNDGVETNKVKVGDITITDQGINGGTKQITNIASGIDGKQYTDAAKLTCSTTETGQCFFVCRC